MSEQKLRQGFCSNSHAFTGAKCDEAHNRPILFSIRSINSNLGVTPDIIVEQPRRRANDEEETGFQFRSEADLRGSLSNDSLSEDEIQQIEEDRAKAEETAKLRKADYQLAYAIDILTGLNALGPKN